MLHECNFYIGQKVVCINSSYHHPDFIPCSREKFSLEPMMITEGRIYAIVNIHIHHSAYLSKPEPCLTLSEVTGRLYYWRRFRPLTDIKIFENMLSENVLEDA